MTTPKITDKVRYKKDYVQQVHLVSGHDLSDYIGEIVKIDQYAWDFAIATVQWNSELGYAPKRGRTNLENLELVQEKVNV